MTREIELMLTVICHKLNVISAYYEENNTIEKKKTELKGYNYAVGFKTNFVAHNVHLYLSAKSLLLTW